MAKVVFEMSFPKKTRTLMLLSLPKVGSVGPVDQQFNFVLLLVLPLKSICEQFYTTIICESIFFKLKHH